MSTEAIKISVEFNVEEAYRFPDVRLRLLIRKAVLDATEHDVLTIDEAIKIVEDEAEYLNKRLKS